MEGRRLVKRSLEEIGRSLDEARSALNAMEGFVAFSRWRHKKTGMLVCDVELVLIESVAEVAVAYEEDFETTSDFDAKEEAGMVGVKWVRPWREFVERFEVVSER